MISPREQDRRRVAGAIVALAGCPGYVLCFFEHTILHGHLGHPPYPAWTLFSDVLWIAAFAVAVVLAFRSSMQWRVAFCVLLGFLSLSRLVLGSDGGTLTLCGELPAMIVVCAIACRALLPK